MRPLIYPAIPLAVLGVMLVGSELTGRPVPSAFGGALAVSGLHHVAARRASP